jgi:hypothetical protein
VNRTKTAALLLAIAVMTICITAFQVVMFLPVCEVEDSTFCAWNAKTQGNGLGQSFITLWEGMTIRF